MQSQPANIILSSRQNPQRWEGVYELSYECGIPSNPDDCGSAPSGTVTISAAVSVQLDRVFGYDRYLLSPVVNAHDGERSTSILLHTAAGDGQFHTFSMSGPVKQVGTWLVEPQFLVRPKE